MADSQIAITAGSGTNVDTQVPTGGDHRQVVVLGDPGTIAGVAPVSATQGVYAATAAQVATAVTGSITTSSTTVTIAAAGYGTGTITIRGTHSGIAVVFEVSDDGTNFYSTQVIRESDQQPVAADTLATNAAVMYSLDLAGLTNFQVRSTAFGTGTGAVRLSASGMPSTPLVSIGNAAFSTPGTPTRVGTSTTSASVASANTLRRYICLFNEGSAVAYVSLGSGAATTTAYSFQLKAGQAWEAVGYTGAITAITSTGTGNIQRTEVTA